MADRLRVTAALGALAAQIVLVTVVFWPLPLHPATTVAGGGFNWIIDLPLLQFIAAWETRALLGDPSHFFDAPMFHPTPRAGLYGPTCLGILPAFAPIFWWTGDVRLAMNGAFCASLALTAWTSHLVVRRWTGLWTAGLVAGAVVLTAEWIVRTWVPSAPSYAALQWFPLLIARATLPVERPRDWAIIVGLAWLQCLTDVVYVAPAVLAPLATHGAVQCLRGRDRRRGLALLAAAVVAGTALLPLLAAHAAARADNPQLLQQTTWTLRYPPVLPYDLVAGPTALPRATWLLLALGAAVCVGRRSAGHRRREDGPWAAVCVWALVGVVLSFARGFVWGEHVLINPALTRLAAAVPAIDAIRLPERLRVATLIALVLAAGLAFAECVRLARFVLRRWRRPARLAPIGLGAAILGGLAVGIPDLLAYPVQPIHAPKPGLVAVLSRGHGAVVEAPAPPDDTLVHVAAMVRAIEHRRPVLNGYSGYYPRGFPDRMKLASALPDRDALRRLRETADVGTVVVARARLTPELEAAWRAEVDDPRSPFRLVWRDVFVLVFDIVDIAATRR